MSEIYMTRWLHPYLSPMPESRLLQFSQYSWSSPSSMCLLKIFLQPRVFSTSSHSPSPALSLNVCCLFTFYSPILPDSKSFLDSPQNTAYSSLLILTSSSSFPASWVWVSLWNHGASPLTPTQQWVFLSKSESSKRSLRPVGFQYITLQEAYVLAKS